MNIFARAVAAGAAQVELLPTVIDTERYTAQPRQIDRIFTVGWIGTPVTAKYLEIAAGALKNVCADGRTRLALVGAGDVSFSGIPIDRYAWSEDTETTKLGLFDVGIMPLPDGPWERGKSGYKLIQYMAVGKPCVASPVGVNTQLIEAGVTGFLAGTKQDWIEALSRLRDNPGQAAQMGLRGRHKVEREFSLQALAPRLARLLMDAAQTARG